jgi:hypothetical protein
MTQEDLKTAHPQVAQPPKPAREFAGGGWIASTPQGLAQPEGFPPYFPNELKTQTEIVLRKAYRAFKTGPEIVDLCKHVIADLSPHLHAMVKEKTLRADLALRAMDGLMISQINWNSKPAQRDGLLQKVKVSDEWLRLAEGCAPTAAPNQKPNDPSLPNWARIEVVFTSDHRVQIIRDGKPNESLNYADMGFKDDRTGNPILAWNTFCELAKANGVIGRPSAWNGSGSRRALTSLEKRIQEIRKILKAHFHVSSDPIPLTPSGRYEAAFKVGRAPSYDT